LNTERISGYQLFMLCSILYINGGMISLYKTLSEVAGPDAWFNFIFSMLYAIFIAFLLYKLSEAHPGKNMFEISESVCGKWGGKLLNILVMLYILHLIIRDLRMFGDFVGTAVLQRTPTEFIYLSAMLVLMYYATGNMEEFARSVNLFFPIFIISIVLLPLLLVNETDLSNLLPILSQGSGVILKGGVLSTGWAGDIFIFGAFLNYIRNSRQYYESLKLGIVTSAFVLTVMMLLCTAILGHTITGRAMYPAYTMMQEINITDFLDRLDVVLIGFWMPAFLMKIIVIYFSFMAGLSSMLNTGKLRGINMMSGWMILLLTLVSFRSVMEVYRFGNYAAVPITVFVQFCFLAVVGLCSLWKTRKKWKHPPRQSLQEDGGAAPGRGDVIGWWLSLAVCMAGLFGGSVTGSWFKLYGQLGGIVYFIAFVGLFVFSIRLFWRWNQIVRHPSPS